MSNNENTGRVAISDKIFNLLMMDDQFYRDVTSIKRLSLPKFPKYDQWCQGGFFNIEMALAGYDIADISVSSEYNENSILVVGNKNEGTESNVTKGMVVRGIARRNFKIGFIVNRIYNAKKSSVTLRNGILRIKIPKIKEIETERVMLEVSDGTN